MLRLVPIAAVLLSLGGCPAPAEVDPGPVVGPPVGAGPAAERSPELDAARERWMAAGLDAYAFTLRRSCFCPSPDYTGPFEVTVRGGAIDTVRLDGATVDDERGMTVDDLFDLLEDAYERGAVRVDADFDAELGYPTSLYVDYDQRIADEEIGYFVSELAAADR